jgi:cold shock protein
MEGKRTGVVKWFDNKKGYGFIESEGLEDVFAHFRQINAEGYRSLKPGDEVEFDLVEGQKGLQADNIIVTQAS